MVPDNKQDLSFNEENIIQMISEIIRDAERDLSKMEYKKTKSYLLISFYDLAYIRYISNQKSQFISIPVHLNHIIKLFKLNDLATEKSGWIKIPFVYIGQTFDLPKLILEIYDTCYAKVVGETFGCCSKYLECSDAKLCIQESEQWSKGCAYRKNLINGKIFYGKNSTISK